MNWKKVVSVLLVSTMALSVAACGNDTNSGTTTGAADNGGVTAEPTESKSVEDQLADVGTESEEEVTYPDLTGQKLVVWTLSNDLQQFAERFQEKTGAEVEVVVTEPANYPTKVQTALNGGETEPDVIVGEPKMLEDYGCRVL